ncbi:solute carrier family 52, riboflavin transporter, member 3 [Plakobranchus ocellatus]|uniref:Riboflavin transporter n=1 Tax=Plakobranchus ocellatus TaxID=259542 RepID=A0AAV4D5U9_9GAST|nr:solute carrier family 52, riboflavin transporter, member 3 [Plakobranchus ocellatus]
MDNEIPKTRTQRRKKWMQGRGRLSVHILVIIFGITSWSIMNGLWVELPILVSYLPEGWTLPSDLTIVGQFGNLGPLAFSLLVYLFPRVKLEVPASILIVVVLSLCALLFSFLWRETATFGGSEYSIALLGLTFVQSVFAAMTSQAYLAFMSHLKARYMSSIFLGMSLSGLIPALVAVAQGSGTVRCISEKNIPSPSLEDSAGKNVLLTELPQENKSSGYIVATDNRTSSNSTQQVFEILKANSYEPALTVQHFFLLLFGLGLFSLLALLLLLYHPRCREEHVDADKEENCQLTSSTQKSSPEALKNGLVDSETGRGTNGGGISPGTELEDKFENQLSQSTTAHEQTNGSPVNDEGKHSETEGISDNNSDKILGKLESWYLLFLLAWINAVQTSFLLAVQVYSSLPYGLKFYNGATKAENIVDPIACFITIFITAKTSKVISALTLLGTLLASYIITMAALSPEPLLVDHLAGGILVIFFWICCTMVMVYTKVSIAAVMRSQGRLSLIWTGASTQTGAFLGAVLAYVMVNHLGLFKDAPWCPDDQRAISGVGE